MSGQERLLDVSDLGPPEPLMRTLSAAESLGSGEYLRMRHRMKPCMLYDALEPRGFGHDTRSGEGGMCEVFIWRTADTVAATAAHASAALLPEWQD